MLLLRFGPRTRLDEFPCRVLFELLGLCLAKIREFALKLIGHLANCQYAILNELLALILALFNLESRIELLRLRVLRSCSRS